MSLVLRCHLPALAMAWLLSVGRADSVVDPSFGLDPAVKGRVDAVCLRPDGKILLAGKLRLADASRCLVVQLDSTGRLDPGFQPLRTDWILDDWDPMSLVLPSDGYALLALGGTIQRLSPDGREVRWWAEHGWAGTGATDLRPRIVAHSGVTLFLTLLPDGKVMVWGHSYWTAGTGGFSQGVLYRRLADGRLDPAFWVAESLLKDGNQGRVLDFAVARNGDYLVAGEFWDPVIRLSADGRSQWSSSALRAIREAGIWESGFVREDTNGKILVVGTYNSGIHRLGADGMPDVESFDPPGYWRREKASVLLRDGRLLDSGPFTNVFGLSRRGLVCLTDDGLVDLRFDPGLGVTPETEVHCLAEQPDGRVLVSGSFSEFDGIPAAGLVRIFTRNPGQAAGPTNQFHVRGIRTRVGECGAPLEVRVTRNGYLEGSHHVPVRSKSGTAVAGQDFIPLETNLVFAPGERFKTITLKMVADQLLEPEETFSIHLGPSIPPAGFSTGDTLEIQIQDLDCEVSFSTNRISVGEGSLQEFGPIPSVSIRRPYDTLVRVKSRDISAIAGRDYRPVDERVWGGWGLVSAWDDPTADGERSYLLELVDEGEGFLFGANSNVVVTIRDDDTPLGASRWISGAVDAVHAAPGGGWLLSGTFDRVDGVPRPGLARFGADGLFDATFRPPDPLSEGTPQVAVDALGRVLVAGTFPPALDPVGRGLIRLSPAGELDPTFLVSSQDSPLPDCRDTPNQITQMRVEGDGSLIVAGTLPRFSNCRAPSHVVRLSPDGLRTHQWILPDGVGQAQQVLETGGGLMAMGTGGLVRLEENGQVSPVFEIQNHPWARFPLNGVPWPDGSLWVEASSGELMRVQPFRPAPIPMEVPHNGRVLKPRQWSVFHRLSPDRVLAAATFVPTNTPPQPVVPLLLVVDASGSILRFSEIPPSQDPWSLKSLAVDDQGVIAGVSDAWRGGLKWWRFSPDLSPVADLTLEAAVPTDGGAFLRLRGQAPRGYSIEVSDDLQSWRPGSFRSEIHWGQTFLEPDAHPGKEARYYRARF